MLAAEDWFDSVAGCARLCGKVVECGAFATRYYESDNTESYRGYRCQIGFNKYGNLAERK